MIVLIFSKALLNNEVLYCVGSYCYLYFNKAGDRDLIYFSSYILNNWILENQYFDSDNINFKSSALNNITISNNISLLYTYNYNSAING